MEKRKHIVILAAGDFPTHEVPLRTLRDADFVVCCDSAYGNLKAAAPAIAASAVVIGDGDSLPEADKMALGDRWIHVAEQDYNDLHKAMAFATSRFSILNSQFLILGATGRREDHTIGNIGYLATFAGEYPCIDMEMLSDYGRFTLCAGIRSYATFARQQVSLFSLDPRTVIYASGLRFPVEGLHFDRWWQGTLNEALGERVEVRSDAPVIVFLTYDPK